MDNNWTINQTKELFGYVSQAVEQGVGLKSAFARMSEKTGRSLNSVRNYYYSQLKMLKLVPALAEQLGITPIGNQRAEFDTFTEEEVNELIRTILIGKANGVSVRATIAAMSDNSKQALRLQNKYRSVVAHHRVKVNDIMSKLSGEGKAYYNPYTKKVVGTGDEPDNLVRLNEYVAKLDSTQVGNFLDLIEKLI